jgi:hypothetical protein
VSRRTQGDSLDAYRVRVERLYADESGSYQTYWAGPYATLAAAKAQRKRELREATTGGRKARAVIEHAVTIWEEVTE